MLRTPQTPPLETWIGRKIGLADGHIPGRADLERYQLKALNRTLARVRQRSLFYRKKLRDLPSAPLPDLEALAGLPFTTAEEVARDPLALLCVSQGCIARAVTLTTSGTTGPPKRFLFTPGDLELTLDFFHHGMATLVAPGQRVLILLPGKAPCSVGDLLVKALARMDVQGVLMDPETAPERVLAALRKTPVHSVVGTPLQLLALVRGPADPLPRGQIRTVLLSTDYVPRAICTALEESWGCRVFQHYGMTEMGYGGAVDCGFRRAYHLREGDLLFEVVDPQTGDPLPAGRAGEVVFSTLTHEGMPLLRYRTGDLAVMPPEPCACGSVLGSLGHVQGRLNNRAVLGNGAILEMAALDEALFSLPEVVSFTAELKEAAGQDHLRLTLYALDAPAGTRESAVQSALGKIDALGTALASGELQIAPLQWHPAASSSLRPVKRQLMDQRTGRYA